MSVCHLLLSLIMSASATGDASVGDALLSPIAGSRPLSTVLSCFLSPIADGDLLSAILCRFLSFIAGSSPLSTVLGRLLSVVPSASSQALFITSIPSRAHCFSLLSLLFFYSSWPFLPISLICDPAPLTEKRLFD